MSKMPDIISNEPETMVTYVVDKNVINVFPSPPNYLAPGTVRSYFSLYRPAPSLHQVGVTVISPACHHEFDRFPSIEEHLAEVFLTAPLRRTDVSQSAL